MPLLESGKCKACSKEIVKIKTSRGERLLLDPEPVWILKETGGATYVKRDGTYVFGVEIGESYDGDGAIEVYVPHLSTCPYGGKSTRKPRDRVESDKRKGYFIDVMETSYEKSRG